MNASSSPRGRGSSLTVILALLLAACGSSPAKQSFYTLSVAAPASVPAASASNTSVYVGPVTVPESVDRIPMVIRTSPNQVEISDDHRWAEPLKSAIPRVLAEVLMRELGTPRVMATRVGASQPVDYRVAVEIQRFDSSPAQGAAIDALWTVTPAKGAARSGRSSVVEPASPGDPGGLAAAHSRALERIGGEIASSIRALR